MDFFIGSNSGRGFFSFFDSFYGESDARRVFLLKGGAGSGKSTLMKKAAAAAEQAGLAAERIHCPSDPASLDAVHIPSRGSVIIDATAPHALEPKCHGGLEHYVSLSDCLSWDAAEKKKEAFGLQREISACHARARESFAAAERAFASAFDLVIPHVNAERIAKKALSLAPALAGDSPKVMRRFLSGLTPEGVVRYPQTLETLIGAGRVFRISDSYGLSPLLLAPLAASAGSPVYSCACPLNPSKTEHLIFPALKTAFISAPFAAPEGAETVSIRLDSAIDAAWLRENRVRLRLLRKTGAALAAQGCAHLSSAKALHDQLEALYVPYTDYKALDALAERIIPQMLEKA